ncbi:hypothetical protein O3P69_001988 [Scylla paramamosain]|uniref:Uncharacterized protein n=1 Tax=Scylla paramamosain TaxID=85552 RepID=A0AAW0V510_SCYPA
MSGGRGGKREEREGGGEGERRGEAGGRARLGCGWSGSLVRLPSSRQADLVVVTALPDALQLSLPPHSTPYATPHPGAGAPPPRSPSRQAPPSFLSQAAHKINYRSLHVPVAHLCSGPPLGALLLRLQIRAIHLLHLSTVSSSPSEVGTLTICRTQRNLDQLGE